MITTEQWKQLKQEFGDRAFDRFGFAFMGEGIGLANPQCNRDIELYECPLRPLPDLYANDVKFYGSVENAIAMWQWRYVDGSNDWQDCNKALSFNPNKEYRRKDSAGLDFDLERAKAGYVFEYFDNGAWCNAEISDYSDKEGLTIFISSRACYIDNPQFTKLRMKYLPRVNL